VNGSPIGYCDWFQKDGIVKFEEFVILKEYQGKGYGTKMLQKMIHDTVRQGNQHIYVVTDAEGTEHNLYYKLGFNFVGEETELFYLE
jgi:spore maturation protein CgeE